jgi:hypothetical protein
MSHYICWCIVYYLLNATIDPVYDPTRLVEQDPSEHNFDNKYMCVMGGCHYL